VYTLSVENQKGERLNLTEHSDYDLIKINGLNPPNATLNFSELANYDGTIYNSGQLQNRNLVLYIVLKNDIEKSRINLYKYFPSKKTVRIFYENDSRSVYIDGRIETFIFDPFENGETVQISIVCPNPYWKENTETIINFSNTIDLFEFPFAIEEAGIEFSRIENITTAYIENGEVETGFIVEFQATTNQILNPKIFNRTTQEFFGVNFDMNEGDVIRINTNRGKKSVVLIRDGVETNILNSMQDGSKWLYLAAGINEFSYECDEGQINLIVKVINTVCFEGV
jgi:hypothetical protein